MTAGLPGLRTVPSPLAPRLQAGADLHVHTTHSDGLCSPCDLRAETLGQLAAAGLGAIVVAGPGISNRLGRRFGAWADEFHLVPITGSDFHAPDRPGRWVGSVTTPPADLDRLRRARPANPSSDGLAES